MNMLMNLVLALQILTALVMIGLVLIQHGKGADMGASFGSGASGSLFGATGSANFLSRSTAVLRRRLLRLHARPGLHLERPAARRRPAACSTAPRRAAPAPAAGASGAARDSRRRPAALPPARRRRRIGGRRIARRSRAVAVSGLRFRRSRSACFG